MSSNDRAGPQRHLSILDAICVIVGIVVGTGIYKSPILVALNTSGAGAMMLAWAAGGLLCFCGALSYAELAAAYPHVGGEYVYLSRSFGPMVGFLFVWARATVIQSGTIAATAYVFGDYMSALSGMGTLGPIGWALQATVALTACNVVGLRTGAWTQNLLTGAKVAGVLGIVVAGLVLVSPAAVPAAATAPADASAGPGLAAFGLAMVFVLYAYGGWNEAAYVAGELRRKPRDMFWVLLISVALLTGLYLVVNFAYLRALGFERMRASPVVAAETVARAFGAGGRVAVTALVAVSALGAANGCLFTGSRAICALGDDWPLFRPLGRWHARFRTPVNAVLLQGAVSCALIVLPALSRDLRESLGSGFQTAVEYTAPTFWAFFLLTGVAVVVLRFKDPSTPRPFRVPLFPVTVGAFCLMCAYMLYSSLDYRSAGATVGLYVLLAGVPLYALCRSRKRAAG